MLTIKISFPWGRYYAHPWGQNPVRISEAEWPPSPWRLLRTLAAAWFRLNLGQTPSDELCALLKPLGQTLPMIQLGKVSFGNTVHYHPNPGVPSGKVRHENHFAATDREVAFHWQLEPDEESNIHRQLTDLTDEIHYFGRAESIAEFSVEHSVTTIDEAACARVVVNDGQPGRRIAADCRDVFCPNPSDFEVRDLWACRNAEQVPHLAPTHLVQDLFDFAQPLPDGAKWFSFQMPEGWPQEHVVRFPKRSKCKLMSKRIIAKYLEFSLQCRIPIPAKHTVSIAMEGSVACELLGCGRNG